MWILFASCFSVLFSDGVEMGSWGERVEEFLTTYCTSRLNRFIRIEIDR